MKQVSAIAEVRAFLENYRQAGKTIGFVPTMGALHEGHLALIRQAKAGNDLCVASIFVNPTQFNNREDLDKYPRNLAADAKLLEREGCDLLFAPGVEEIYPEGEQNLLKMELGRLDKVMEGRFRPGHFAGVTTVVHRLFTIVTPHRAYFGKKDYQQLTIIIEMVKQLNLPVEIIPYETVREADGLAMSSRNMRLTIAERQKAPLIHKVLKGISAKAGIRSVKEVKAWGLRQFEKNPEFRVEYLEIADKSTLQPITTWQQKDSAVVLVAVFLGDVRLIDNLELFS